MAIIRVWRSECAVVLAGSLFAVLHAFMLSVPPASVASDEIAKDSRNLLPFGLRCAVAYHRQVRVIRRRSRIWPLPLHEEWSR